MTGPETIKVNGVTVRTSEIEWTDTRENGAKGIKFKNGVFALVQEAQQNSKATLYSDDSNTTLGYNLIGVKIIGNPNKEDHIILTNSERNQVITTEDKYSEDKKDLIIFQYEGNRLAKQNTVSTSNEDSLFVVANTNPERETWHKGQLNGMY